MNNFFTNVGRILLMVSVTLALIYILFPLIIAAIVLWAIFSLEDWTFIKR